MWTSTPGNFPFDDTKPSSSDEVFMLFALEEAWKAFLQGEVPVGAVLVYQGEIIGRGYNQVEIRRDATAHAEMICLSQASEHLEGWRLLGATLYSTLEPCAMCAGAMFLSRIETLVWGAPDYRHGVNGSWVDLFSSNHPIHRIEVRKGILSHLSAELLRQFFILQRKKK